MESYEELYTRLLNEVEKFARSLLEANFKSIQELWQLEVGLINFQSMLQEAISNEQAIRQELKNKKAEIVLKRLKDWMAQVQQLDAEVRRIDNRIKIYRHAYQLSRKLGDAFAWILFRTWLIPLTEKPSTPTQDEHGLPKEHGLKGMLAIAETLLAAGAGFPILHDITSILCIGDITFYSPDGNYITIEVKTHFVEKKDDILTLDIEVHFPALIHSNESIKWKAINDCIPKRIFIPDADEQNTSSNQKRLSPRLKRQLERMKQAKVWQSALPDQIVKLNDHKQGINIYHQQDEKAYNWDIVRDLIIKARANGIASCAVDNAFVYVALYKQSHRPWLQDPITFPSESLIADTLSILYPESEKERNKIWIPPSITPSNSIPFFLYPLPLDVVMDIMWGRLTLTVIANLGKIATALEEIGLDIDLPNNRKEFEKFFLIISTTKTLADNQVVKMELHQIYSIALKMFFEFLSLQDFVKQISEMIEIAWEQAKNQKEPLS